MILEVIRGCAADVVSAVQMHLDDSIPLIDTHFVKKAVAQNAGVVDHAVNLPERIHRRGDNPRGARRIGHAVGVGHRIAASRLDLGHHFLRRAGITAFTRNGCADIVHHHLRALRRERQRHVAPDAAARAGNDHHLSFDHLCHALLQQVD